MHNLPVLVKGKPRCTLQVHPSDAETLGLTTGEHATVTSAAAAVDAVVEVTDAVAPGTVSLPHGWGHDIDGVKMTVASAAGGTNSNALTSSEIDPVSGNAQLNAIPVTIAAATGQSGL
jgi:anaerobic selenocysteine-containing dehydrogenase